mmetsp:Transcript_52291/g.131311  ORF Transcript_52291/g.131311 Transcript_52291/m.131311 type:complete len:496 (+) Transcript_52291:3701-5188(+)
MRPRKKKTSSHAREVSTRSLSTENLANVGGSASLSSLSSACMSGASRVSRDRPFNFARAASCFKRRADRNFANDWWNGRRRPSSASTQNSLRSSMAFSLDSSIDSPSSGCMSSARNRAGRCACRTGAVARLTGLGRRRADTSISHTRKKAAALVRSLRGWGGRAARAGVSSSTLCRSHSYHHCAVQKAGHAARPVEWGSESTRKRRASTTSDGLPWYGVRCATVCRRLLMAAGVRGVRPLASPPTLLVSAAPSKRIVRACGAAGTLAEMASCNPGACTKGVCRCGRHAASRSNRVSTSRDHDWDVSSSSSTKCSVWQNGTTERSSGMQPKEKTTCRISTELRSGGATKDAVVRLRVCRAFTCSMKGLMHGRGSWSTSSSRRMTGWLTRAWMRAASSTPLSRAAGGDMRPAWRCSVASTADASTAEVIGVGSGEAAWKASKPPSARNRSDAAVYTAMGREADSSDCAPSFLLWKRCSSSQPLWLQAAPGVLTRLSR